ncbi:hypothetical protein ZWY2020_044886 [Hordeum vulgare]|nr:hypothetical protein ZWY2020_044886 [Hordeum vulgare]
MEAAVGAASSLLGKVLTKLSEDLVAAYVDSLELGHNSEQIQTKLLHTQGLLQLAEGRDASNVTALPALLEKLSNKADEAEDLLDELHYFTIQDQLDGTHYAAPDLGDGLRGHARHGLHALRYTIGNWFPCFSCSRAQDDDSAPTAVANSPHHYATNSATASADDGGHVDRLHFDRVAMSSKINALAFHNLGEVEDMRIEDVSHISWTDLEKLKSLRKLVVRRCDSMFCGELDGSVVFHNMDKVESLCVNVSHLTGKLLSKVFNSCPALANLEINSSREDQEERVIQFPSSSSLQALNFSFLKGLVLLPAEDGGGLQDTTSLQSLNIMYCDRLFSRWPMGEAGGAPMTNPFPASLRKLDIFGQSGMRSMALLSNLTSLTYLSLIGHKDLTVDGFNPLITVNLKELEVWNFSGNSMAADLLSEVAMTKTMQEGSFQLENLHVDSISAVLVAPICNHLSATLHNLVFYNDMRAKGFTEEQENALQLLTSLRTLGFIHCMVLQCLPQGLRHLSSLKTLKVSSCPQLRLLPEDGFPTSLQSLSLGYDSADQKEQAEKLEGTYPNLIVHSYSAQG